MHPERPIGLFLIGVVAMKWIAIGIVVLELAFSKDPSHLGAALAGAMFGVAEKRGVRLGAWANVFFRDRAPRRGSARSASVERPSRRSAAPRRAPKPVMDVDAVLDKINESGFDSLTAEERQVLDRAGRG